MLDRMRRSNDISVTWQGALQVCLTEDGRRLIGDDEGRMERTVADIAARTHDLEALQAQKVEAMYAAASCEASPSVVGTGFPLQRSQRAQTERRDIQLYGYQRELVDNIATPWEGEPSTMMMTMDAEDSESMSCVQVDNDDVLACLPTGAGKTVIAAAMIRRWALPRAQKTLVLVNRKNLRDDGATAIQRDLPGSASVAVLRPFATSKAHEMVDLVSSLRTADVILATVQTLSRVSTRIPHRKGVGLKSASRLSFGLLIVDEAHGAVASGYSTVLRYFKNLQEPRAILSLRLHRFAVSSRIFDLLNNLFTRKENGPSAASSTVGARSAAHHVP